MDNSNCCTLVKCPEMLFQAPQAIELAALEKHSSLRRWLTSKCSCLIHLYKNKVLHIWGKIIDKIAVPP